MKERDGDDPALSPDLAGTIHDAANALTVVLGWLERAKLGDVEVTMALARAESHARWSRDKLRRLLGAHDQSSPSNRGARAVRAASLLETTAEDLGFEAAAAGVRLEIAIDVECKTSNVLAGSELWQILSNLILNAIAASPLDGVVSLSLDTVDAARVRFTIEDDGPGIDEERRLSLFEGGRSTRPNGAGDGLRHSFILASRAGGQLRFCERSRSGARFELEWPTLARRDECAEDSISEAHPHVAGSAERSSLAGMRLLMLEDDDAIVELLELSLAARGAEIRTVSTGSAFESALSTERFDVALFDLSPLPGDEDGERSRTLVRLVDLACTARPRVALLAISGAASPPAHPSVVYLRKPFSPEELAEAIRDAKAEAQAIVR